MHAELIKNEWQLSRATLNPNNACFLSEYFLIDIVFLFFVKKYRQIYADWVTFGRI